MRFDYEPGEVVEVEHRGLYGEPMIVRCGVVLDNRFGKHKSRHLVLIGLEKWECVIAGGIFITCKRSD